MAGSSLPMVRKLAAPSTRPAPLLFQEYNAGRAVTAVGNEACQNAARDVRTASDAVPTRVRSDRRGDTRSRRLNSHDAAVGRTGAAWSAASCPTVRIWQVPSGRSAASAWLPKPRRRTESQLVPRCPGPPRSLRSPRIAMRFTVRRGLAIHEARLSMRLDLACVDLLRRDRHREGRRGCPARASRFRAGVMNDPRRRRRSLPWIRRGGCERFRQTKVDEASALIFNHAASSKFLQAFEAEVARTNPVRSSARSAPLRTRKLAAAAHRV